MGQAKHPQRIEGTWEEILAQSGNLAGRRVRVVVLPDKPVSLQQKIDAWFQRVDAAVPQPRAPRNGEEGELERMIAEKLRRQGLELF